MVSVVVMPSEYPTIDNIVSYRDHWLMTQRPARALSRHIIQKKRMIANPFNVIYINLCFHLPFTAAPTISQINLNITAETQSFLQREVSKSFKQAYKRSSC